jgi:basic membrane protein A
MSTSHVVGAVGGADIPVQREILNAYKLGAEKAVPGTRGLDVITGDFNDAAKGREAATTMIGNGADVIWHAADVTGLGALQAAGAANVKAIGAYADQESVAPQSVGTSFELGSEYELLTVADAVRNNDSSFPWGQAWKPPLSKIWFPIWKDSDHNSSIISNQVWQQWLTVWNDLTAGKITVPVNTQ